MKTISKFVACAFILISQTALALPPLWENAYQGQLLNGTAGGAFINGAPSGQIDGVENVALGFNFPFGGATYNRVSVDSDGGIILTNIDAVGNVAPTTWNKGFFQSNFANRGQGTAVPMILPFNTSLDQLNSAGEVWYASYNGNFNGYTGMRGVITWERSSLKTFGTADITFQVVLLGDGTIIFSYQTITDPATVWNTKAEQGIVIGVSRGDGTWPQGSQNLDAGDFGIDLVGYQIWCQNEEPTNPPNCAQALLGKNGDFDLDDKSIVFNPDGSTGFLVSNGINGIKPGAGAGGSDVCAVIASGGVNTAVGSGGGGGGAISMLFFLFLAPGVFAGFLRRRNNRWSEG